MDNKLTIIVTGASASGKSTMVLELERLLRENGFNIDISLEGNYEYVSIDDYINMESKHHDEKVEAVKLKTKITLMDMQSNRELKINK